MRHTCFRSLLIFCLSSGHRFCRVHGDCCAASITGLVAAGVVWSRKATAGASWHAAVADGVVHERVRQASVRRMEVGVCSPHAREPACMRHFTFFAAALPPRAPASAAFLGDLLLRDSMGCISLGADCSAAAATAQRDSRHGRYFCFNHGRRRAAGRVTCARRKKQLLQMLFALSYLCSALTERFCCCHSATRSTSRTKNLSDSQAHHRHSAWSPVVTTLVQSRWQQP